MTWKIEKYGNFDISGSILIAGLPGIGNVGKIVVDFLVDELKAEKLCGFHSYYMPHSVFVKEDNLIHLPKIELHFKQMETVKLVLLTGDVQPIDEISCYSLCDTLLDFFEQNKGSEIITLGGIGLSSIQNNPKVYCTGNHKEIVDRYAENTQMKRDIFGVVGPIVGVSGVLLGLAKKRNIKAVSLLAETLGHPMYLGLKGSREIIKILNSRFSLRTDLKNLENEIKEFESKMKIAEELEKGTGRRRQRDKRDVSYIG